MLVSELVKKSRSYRRFYEKDPAARAAGSMRDTCLADIADYQATWSSA